MAKCQSGGQTARFIINTKQKLGLGLPKSKKRKSALSNDWSQQLAEELHKPITRKFLKRTVISDSIDKNWTADLVEMLKFSKWNKWIKYLLMVIDVFSKYGWIEGLNNKQKTESVSKAFDSIFKKKVRENQKCFGQINVLSLLVKDLRIFLIKMESNYITLKLKKKQVLLKDGRKQ